LVSSVAGFERLLLATKQYARCPSRSKARSWPQNCRDLANVGLGRLLFSDTLKYV
jgi:hypothetical protein